MTDKRILVGLAGGSASGKTSFIRSLSDMFAEDELVVVSQDNYYKPMSLQQRDERGEVNFDLPSAIDFKRLIKDVKHLQSGRKVSMVEYTFNNPKVFPKHLELYPAQIIIVEGLFIYSDQKLKKLFDWRMYIHTELKVAKERRLKRDTMERGMSTEEVLHQWENHVLPSYHEMLKYHKDDAHFVIDNTESFEELLEEVHAELRSFLKS